MKVRNAVNNAINRCRDCPFWKEYTIPCGSRMGKCRNENSFFYEFSRTQYANICEEARGK